MKDYNEIADSILARRDKYEKARKEKRKKMIVFLSAMCCLFVAVLAVGISRGGWRDLKTLPTLTSSTQKTDNVVTNEQDTLSLVTNKTNVITTQLPVSDEFSEILPDGGSNSSGDGGHLWMIPALPFDRSIKLTGEAITDEEAKIYFEENKISIVSSLSASGVPADSIKILDKGYCHVFYDGTEGKSFEIRQNFRDYLVYNGDDLVAIITLFKENGQIFCTPAFGGAWFKNYGNYLKEHKGEKLVYVYAKFYEIIIAPDNTYFNPLGADDNYVGMDITGEYLEGVDNPYEVFYHELATYTP